MIILGGYGGQATQEPNPPYPTYVEPAGSQTDYKQQPPYPAAYPPQPQPSYYQGPPPDTAYSQPSSCGTPYQATTVTPSYGQGEYHDDEQGIVATSDWAGSSFSDKKIRHTFIKKVCWRLCMKFCNICEYLTTIVTDIYTCSGPCNGSAT